MNDKNTSISVFDEKALSTVSAEDYEYGKNDYDVDRTNAGSTFYAYYNVVCVVAGTGLLGLSSALRQGGWAGMLIIILAWWMSVYTAVILGRCMYLGKNGRLPTYKAIATEAFGVIGGWVAFFFNAWILLGSPILYLVLSGDNFNQLCAGTVAEIGSIPWTIISCAAVGIPFIFIKTMKDFAWTSLLGSVAISVTIIIVIIMAGIDQPNQSVGHDNVIWDGFPMALATIAFSYGGNVVYPNVEASMKKPKSWPIVAISGLSTCAVMYIAIAVCGYYVYGDTVLNPVYNSIPLGIPRIIAIVCITVNVLVSAPIMLTSFALDVEEMMDITVKRHGKVKEFIFRAAFRIFIMAFCGVIGCTIPFFDLLMSLIGAFANCAVIFILPVCFYLKLSGVRNKPIYELAWCAFIIFVGLVGLIFGTWGAISDLIDEFNN